MFPSASVPPTLHKSGFLQWAETSSTFHLKKAVVSFLVTELTDKVWKYRWCFGAVFTLIPTLGAMEMLLSTRCLFWRFKMFLTTTRLWWITDYSPLILFSAGTAFWSISRKKHHSEILCLVLQHPHKRMVGQQGLMGRSQSSVSTWVEVTGEISLIWLLVNSSVWAISKGVSSVREAPWAWFAYTWN